MTKKDFEALAAIIRDCANYVNKECWTDDAEKMRIMIARNLARELRGHNARFDTERFLKACGV